MYLQIAHEQIVAVLVGRLEDRDPGVPVPQGRADQDQPAGRELTLEPLEMDGPDRLLLFGHRRCEVVPRRMDEVDPLGHQAETSILAGTFQPIS